MSQFRRDGFLLGSRVLDDDQVDRLRVEIERVIHDKGRSDIPQPVLLHNMGSEQAMIWQIVNIWTASAAFRDLIFNPAICEEVAQLTDATALRIWHDQIQYKPAGMGGVNMWHQDSLYWGILTPKETQVTAWVALDDVDEQNGCMSMVPGSHTWGHHIEFLQSLQSFDAMPTEYQGHSIDVRTCPVRKGHVHYHHSLTWHGSSANRSDRPRRAIALHYMTQETVYQARGNHVMKPFVKVPDGAVVEGDAFPLVYERASAHA